ncbi:bifunctional UDP-sugar hydrolase/5'-nucleotidase [Sphingosinicella sp. BN140058]|uniref:bifunctional metallophosphatase/5'-nucleotidase n=1 Tax=Sphingosinicella sp. BN140058 TaxID=1892855 RepID=UPI00101056BA|nr:bifunctional metallophosphatase/5'-nucleotidase [Sphingosinicella sp. BN140058]QAY79463.1 bifunctional metallophosphatase/5'-nucleotidase [Sphingosinicella sp. BN140058]
MRIGYALAAASVLSLSACAGQLTEKRAEPVTVKIVAFNDFHGNLEPPKRSIEAPGATSGAKVQVPAGGAAYFAAAIAELRSRNPNHAVVAAGDLIGASPLVSALFLDEPTIAALNMMKVDFNALGNHEFDKGSAEILRIQNGGCAKNTVRQPCRLEPFAGAKFRLLSANTRTAGGGTLVQPYGIKSFGRAKVGFIGLTLREAPSLVTPAGVAGLSFGDEADAANALIPKLKREGADAIVILIHQGGATKVGFNDKSCAGLSGEILPILDRLDPAVDVVVSGHTHNAYVCDYGRINPARPFLLTSAGVAGTLITDLDLVIDPAAHRVVSKRADNIIVQGEAFTGAKGAIPLTDLYPRFAAEPAVAALVARYAAAAAPVAAERVGRLSAPALRTTTEWGEQVLGNLIADAQLAATRAPEAGGAEIAFMNMGGVRADLVPAADGTITYGQVFTVQPFGNTLMVKSFTGRQIRAILEQQFDSGSNSLESPNFLNPSSTLHYAYDLKRPAGQRILDVRVNGTSLDDERVYRVAMSNFLASGGDNFTAFRDGTDVVGGISDVDALVAYLGKQAVLTPPATDRITRR